MVEFPLESEAATVDVIVLSALKRFRCCRNEPRLFFAAIAFIKADYAIFIRGMKLSVFPKAVAPGIETSLASSHLLHEVCRVSVLVQIAFQFHHFAVSSHPHIVTHTFKSFPELLN